MIPSKYGKIIVQNVHSQLKDLTGDHGHKNEMARLNCEFEFRYLSELIVLPLLYEGPKEEAVWP